MPLLMGSNENDEDLSLTKSEVLHANTIAPNRNKILPVGIQIIGGIFEGESNGWVSCLSVSGYCMIIVTDKVLPQYDIPEKDLPAVIFNENGVERIVPNKRVGNAIDDGNSKKYELFDAY